MVRRYKNGLTHEEFMKKCYREDLKYDLHQLKEIYPRTLSGPHKDVWIMMYKHYAADSVLLKQILKKYK